MIKEKFQAYFSILRSWKTISQKYNELETKKIISDKNLITKFLDKISVTEEITKSSFVGGANKIISYLSKVTKHSLGI